LVTFSSFFPADLVEALSKEDDESEYCSVERVVDLLADCVQVKGERLVDVHVELFLLCQAQVVTIPALLTPVYYHSWSGIFALATIIIAITAIFLLFGFFWVHGSCIVGEGCGGAFL
jgi:hypothetical protein